MRIYPFLIIVLTLFFSCKKVAVEDVDMDVDPGSTGKNVLNSNAFITDTTALAVVDDNSITFYKSSSNTQYKIGDILLGAPNSKRPYGFLRKVESSTNNGNSINYSTSQASLNDAFKELHLDVSATESIDAQQTFRTKEAGDLNLKLNFSENTTLIPGLKINGSFEVKFSRTKIKYEKEAGSIGPRYALISTELSAGSTQLDVTTTGPMVDLKALDLATFPLPDFNIIIPIGGVPFPIRCVQKVVIRSGPVSFSAKGKLSLRPSVNATVGTEYINGEWRSLNSMDFRPGANRFDMGNFKIDLAMEASATIINPVYEVSPFGADIIKAYFEAPAELSFKNQLNTPNYSLKLSGKVTAGMSSTFFFDGKKRSVSLSADVIEKTLLEGNWLGEVKIGTQTWALRNLSVTTYRNGDQILHRGDAADPTRPYWVYKNGDEFNEQFFGRNYSWYAVNDLRGLAPEGWHVPTFSEWKTLIDYLGGPTASTASKLLTFQSNSSGFSASYGGDGDFLSLNNYAPNATFWAADDVNTSNGMMIKIRTDGLGITWQPIEYLQEQKYLTNNVRLIKN